jgi:hypothetical protein
MKVKSIKRFEQLKRKHPVKTIPFYAVDNDHITYQASGEINKCVLCGMENISSITPHCKEALDDIGLHILMDSKEELFALFLHSGYGVTEEEAYLASGYTGFTLLLDTEEENGKGFYVYCRDGVFEKDGAVYGGKE